MMENYPNLTLTWTYIAIEKHGSRLKATLT